LPRWAIAFRDCSRHRRATNETDHEFRSIRLKALLPCSASLESSSAESGADQSWGRFWGWDPKENGALLIVMWNAIILHSRWGGLIRERGLAVMSVFGNIVFSLSWFGVNMLGVGLHSYGFIDRAFGTLMTFIASQLVVMALGVLPLKYWRGIQARGKEVSPDQTESLLARSAAAKPG
jgi:cytochrome c biogenesis factor